MTVIAHAGHWLVSVSYLAPLIFLCVFIGIGKVKERREGVVAPPAEKPPTTEGPS